MEELAIAERKILGPIKEGDQYRRRHNNDHDNHIEEVQTLLEKEELLLTDIYKE